ncbi:hypothetical protein C8D87_10275 [Lentzea atacamensis]|uniref:Uncharacterized protein n=1 Tax=Lentzea atacamensis TaxID=531938 RepID=A0ABX9EF72_9PSEU|nr:hypothetical protein C8D87_10275 [Lentzea atacamensis]
MCHSSNKVEQEFYFEVLQGHAVPLPRVRRDQFPGMEPHSALLPIDLGVTEKPHSMWIHPLLISQ